MASCVALMELKNCVSLAETDGTLASIEKRFSPGACRAVGILSKLRSLCSVLRKQEIKDNFTQNLPDHINCGLVDAVHLSALDIGSAIKEPHKRICDKFNTFVGGRDVPDRLEKWLESSSQIRKDCRLPCSCDRL